MDNKTILMVVVAIVLGMLVSNMLKDVCGCKNLIEGQNSWSTEGGCPSLNAGVRDPCPDDGFNPNRPLRAVGRTWSINDAKALGLATGEANPLWRDTACCDPSRFSPADVNIDDNGCIKGGVPMLNYAVSAEWSQDTGGYKCEAADPTVRVSSPGYTTYNNAAADQGNGWCADNCGSGVPGFSPSTQASYSQCRECCQTRPS